MPAAGSFRPGPDKRVPSKGKAQGYSDYFNGGVTKPDVRPAAKPGSAPIRRTGSIDSGYNAAPMRNPRSPANASSSKNGAMSRLDAKSEALRRRLKKKTLLKKSANKVAAKLKK